jgi:hypothetical protein
MTITAKFASFCPTCGKTIKRGEKVEWTKGEKARHTTCGAPTPAAPAPSRGVAFDSRPCRRCGTYCCGDCRSSGPHRPHRGAGSPAPTTPN